MSSSPMCKKCGDYIHHGPVLCESCSAGLVDLKKVPTLDLVEELSKREGVVDVPVPSRTLVVID